MTYINIVGAGGLTKAWVEKACLVSIVVAAFARPEKRERDKPFMMGFKSAPEGLLDAAVIYQVR